jgi:hypothetical protein
MAKHSSIGIQLDVGSVKNVSGLTDIPDMGATPEKLDVTTLADASRQYINGVKDFGDLEFTFIYESGTDGNYAKLNALVGQGPQECIVRFPGEGGATFTFTGEISLRIIGVGVNAVITFAMSVSLQSEIEMN